MKSPASLLFGMEVLLDGASLFVMKSDPVCRKVRCMLIIGAKMYDYVFHFIYQIKTCHETDEPLLDIASVSSDAVLSCMSPSMLIQ